MAIGSFFKQRGSKQFSYEPRYYNEAKETHEKRMKAIERELGMGHRNNPDAYESNIRGAFRHRREEVGRIQRRSNTRIVLIFGVLLFVLYLVVFK